MPVKKPPQAPSLDALSTDEFKSKSVKMRGRRFVIRELSATDYQKCIELATEERDGRQVINNQVLFKFMLIKGLVEPQGMSADEIFKMPYPVVRALNDIVDDLHYTPEESEDDDAPDEDSEGEVEG